MWAKMPMQSECHVKSGPLPTAETNAVAVHFKRRHGGAVKWRCFPAKSHGFCERGHPFAVNGKAASETKAGSLWPAQCSLAPHSLPIALAMVLTLATFAVLLVLLAIAFRLLLPLIFINLVQDQLAHGPFMGHLSEKLELIRIPFDPFINLFIDTRIFA